MTAVLEARELTKRFPGQDRPAVQGVDLDLDGGRVLAVLGSNGAGKTTTLRMLTTLTRPSAGSARVAGYDIASQGAQVRRRIALVGQDAAVDQVLSGRANLILFARLLGLSRGAARTRADELIARFALEDAADRPVRTYSGGMRRRIDLAAGLLTEPTVLFVDEPTTGLDPVGRRELWAALRALTETGTAIVLTTQYLEEADALADDVVFLRDGAVALAGTVQELRHRAGPPRTETRPPTLEELYLTLYGRPAAEETR